LIHCPTAPLPEDESSNHLGADGLETCSRSQSKPYKTNSSYPPVGPVAKQMFACALVVFLTRSLCSQLLTHMGSEAALR
jgi:hypothetical protein